MLLLEPLLCRLGGMFWVIVARPVPSVPREGDDASDLDFGLIGPHHLPPSRGILIHDGVVGHRCL